MSCATLSFRLVLLADSDALTGVAAASGSPARSRSGPGSPRPDSQPPRRESARSSPDPPSSWRPASCRSHGDLAVGGQIRHHHARGLIGHPLRQESRVAARAGGAMAMTPDSFAAGQRTSAHPRGAVLDGLPARRAGRWARRRDWGMVSGRVHPTRCMAWGRYVSAPGRTSSQPAGSSQCAGPAVRHRGDAVVRSDPGIRSPIEL